MKQTKGFTLIEMMVVMSIVSLLSSVVLSAVNSARTKAQMSQISSTAGEYRKAFTLGYDKYGGYPTYPGGALHCLGLNPQCNNSNAVVAGIVAESIALLPSSNLFTFSISGFTFYGPSYMYEKCGSQNGSMDQKNACNTASIKWYSSTCGPGNNLGLYAGSVPPTYSCIINLN